MTASHAKTHPPIVANARHACALRLDRKRFDAPFDHGQKTLSL